MSGRKEGDHSPDARRRRSRFDREPSPKRSRRDAKSEAERGEKRGHQLRDTSSREVALVSDRRAEGSIQNKDSNEKNHKSSDETKHDERGTAGLGGRSSSRRENVERGWWKDSRDRGSDSAADRELRQRGKAPRREAGKDDKVWAHDGFFEMEANPPPPPPLPLNHKRPAFREQKTAADNNQNDRNGRNEDHKPGNGGNRVSNFERRDERGRHERYPDRFEKFSPRGGGRPYRRDERQSGPYGSRDRYGGGNGRFGGTGRGSNIGQPPLHSEGGRVEKWKHDLYDEANKSPPPKNEEDRLAKIEALLAS
ncbi:hypothetical protein MLD38_013423 [Melastoma candidum]|uniref:Uncharacterized protein n=1 Tax=Melastoma candidum TaxID=119954 RepID=A0ACB9R9M6_9MYRT|nr:hypothetical protein MLD38_013423 [Melastoma candidum]